MQFIYIQIFLIVFVIVFCSSTYADEHSVTCIPESTQHNDILGCYINEFKLVDQKLNQMYQNKIHQLSKIKAEQLQESQRIWLKSKIQACTVDEDNYGRESHFDAIQCEIDMTNGRIEFLELKKW